jgi:thioesterase domain-containing protein
MTSISREELPASTVDGLSKKELDAYLESTRAKLASNLDALEDKMNVSKQLDKAGRRLRRKVQIMREDNPLALAGIVAGAVIAVGITAFLMVKISTPKK